MVAADAIYPAAYGFSRAQTLAEGNGDNRYRREVVGGKVAADCMRRSGFEYPDIRWTRAQIVSGWASARHVALSVESARESGYGPAPSFTAAPLPPKGDLGGKELDQYQNRELECVVQGMHMAVADVDGYEAVRETLDVKIDAFESVFAAAAPVQTLVASWTDCVSNDGYDYRSAEASHAAAWTMSPGKARPRRTCRGRRGRRVSTAVTPPSNGPDLFGSADWLEYTNGIVGEWRDRVHLIGRMCREAPARIADSVRAP